MSAPYTSRMRTGTPLGSNDLCTWPLSSWWRSCHFFHGKSHYRETAVQQLLSHMNSNYFPNTIDSHATLPDFFILKRKLLILWVDLVFGCMAFTLQVVLLLQTIKRAVDCTRVLENDWVHLLLLLVSSTESLLMLLFSIVCTFRFTKNIALLDSIVTYFGCVFP